MHGQVQGDSQEGQEASRHRSSDTGTGGPVRGAPLKLASDEPVRQSPQPRRLLLKVPGPQEQLAYAPDRADAVAMAVSVRPRRSLFVS